MNRGVFTAALFIGGLSFFSEAGEITKELKGAHQGVENVGRQLMDAMDGLSRGLGERPIAEEEELTKEALLKNLERFSRDLDSTETFQALKNKEERLRKELKEVVEEWAKQEVREEKDKSKTVLNILVKEKEEARKRLQEVQDKIKRQIESVMSQMEFKKVNEGSTTYQKNDQLVNIRFVEGDIVLNKIKKLPPVDE